MLINRHLYISISERNTDDGYDSFNNCLSYTSDKYLFLFENIVYELIWVDVNNSPCDIIFAIATSSMFFETVAYELIWVDANNSAVVCDTT